MSAALACRFGAAAATTRGEGEAESPRVAEMIDRVLSAGLRGELDGEAGKVREDVRALCGAFALPGHG